MFIHGIYNSFERKILKLTTNFYLLYYPSNRRFTAAAVSSEL